MGSGPLAVKLYSLYLKNWQAEVPMVCPAVRRNERQRIKVVHVSISNLRYYEKLTKLLSPGFDLINLKQYCL